MSKPNSRLPHTFRSSQITCKSPGSFISFGFSLKNWAAAVSILNYTEEIVLDRLKGTYLIEFGQEFVGVCSIQEVTHISLVKEHILL